MDKRDKRIQRNVVACDNFIRELSPPQDSNSSIYRVVAKIVKLWKSPLGFIKGKALSRGTGIGLINFDSYSFGKGFKLGPLTLAAVDPSQLKVNDCLFGLVHELDGTDSTRTLRAFARCTRANSLLSVIEGMHSPRFCSDSYKRFPPEFGICVALLLGRYAYALDMKDTVPDIRKLVLELSLFCKSGRIWRQFCYCLDDQSADQPHDHPHVEYRSIMAFCEKESTNTMRIDSMLLKPLISAKDTELRVNSNIKKVN